MAGMSSKVLPAGPESQLRLQRVKLVVWVMGRNSQLPCPTSRTPMTSNEILQALGGVFRGQLGERVQS